MQVNISKVDGDTYLDVVLSLEEIEAVKENLIVSEITEILGRVVNVGVILEN